MFGIFCRPQNGRTDTVFLDERSEGSIQVFVIVDPSDGEDNLRRVGSPCESYLSGSSIYSEDISVHMLRIQTKERF